MKVKTSYIAKDGTEFKTREECTRYEKRYREDNWREKYFDILYSINYMKRKTFKKMERDLAKARDAYRIAKSKGIKGSKAFRFDTLTVLRYSYLCAKNNLKKEREVFNGKRKDLFKLGVRLGFRKPVLRAQKENRLKKESEVSNV